MDSKPRSLQDWLKIIGELMALYETKWKAATTDGRITVTEGLKLAGDVLEVLARHNVTIEELAELLKSAGPLLSILRIR